MTCWPRIFTHAIILWTVFAQLEIDSNFSTPLTLLNCWHIWCMRNWMQCSVFWWRPHSENFDLSPFLLSFLFLNLSELILWSSSLLFCISFREFMVAQMLKFVLLYFSFCRLALHWNYRKLLTFSRLKKLLSSNCSSRLAMSDQLKEVFL